MPLTNFTLKTNNQTLDCFKITPKRITQKAIVIILHGAGTADKTRYTLLAKDIAAHGYTIYALDFSGHGQSSGKLANQSLQKRCQEAQILINEQTTTEPLVLIGFSMSGQTIGDLLPLYKDRVKAFGLCSPAIYAHQAWNVPFGSGFTSVIRQPGSWHNSSALMAFKQFTGKVVLATPTHDEVIPPEVTQALGASFKNVAKLQFSDARHQLGSYFATNKQARDQFIAALL